METQKKWLRIAAISLLGLMVAACGDDDTDSGRGIPKGELTYVAVGNFGSREDATGYISIIREFGADITLDLREEGIELHGEPLAVAFGDDPYLYVGTSRSGVITRYEATSTGFVESGSVNLAAQGVGQINGYQAALQLISKEKAYFLHEGSRQLVIWNPAELKIEGSRKFTELEQQEGITMQFAGFPLRIDNYLVYGIGWRSATKEKITTIVEGAGALVINTDTDEVTVIRDESRCGYTLSVAEGNDGYIYLASESLTDAARYLDTEDVGGTLPGCLLRFDLESMEIDPEYHHVLSSLYEEAHEYAGTIYPAKEKGKAYMMVLDEDLIPEPGESGHNVRTLTTYHAWLTYELTLGNEPSATRIESLPPTSAGALLVQAGDELYLPEFDNADPATPRTLLRSYEGFERGEVLLEILGHTRSIAKVIR